MYETFLILQIIQQEIFINVYQSSCEVPLLLSHFNEINFLTDFLKILQFRPVGAELMDGWTDMIKLIVAFCNFVNTPKNMATNEVTN